MTIYADIRDIPLEYLANGGEFQIIEGVPQGVRVGEGFAAMDERDAIAHGVIGQAERDEEGEIIKVLGYHVNPVAPGYSIFSAGQAPATLGWDWLIYILIALIVIAAIIAAIPSGGASLSLLFLASMATLAVATYTVTTIWGPKHGIVLGDVNEDGSYTFESDDGTIIHFNADGTYEIVRGPDSGYSIFGDIGTAVKYGAIGIAAIGILYVGAQAYSSVKNKTKFKAPAIDYAVKGVTDIGKSGAGLLTKAV